MKFKKILIISLFLLLSISVFAADWYVCIGSFRSFENAKKVYRTLNSSNVPVKIAEFNVNGAPLYRIIYDEPSPTRQSAHIIRDRIKDNENIKKITPSGLWVLEAVPMALSNETTTPIKKDETPVVKNNNSELKAEIEEGRAHFIEDKKIELTTNTEQLPITEQVPYSVLVNSYKEEQPANRDKVRLSEKNIDSYIVKTYTDSQLFSFDLHSGAFETEDEAYDLIDKLEDLGIYTSELSDFNEIKDDIEQYNEEIQKTSVVFETGNTKIPENISQKLLATIRQFPINKNYQIEQISIVDFENLDYTNSRTVDTFENDDFLDDMLYEFTDEIEKGELEAVSCVKYKDELFDKDISVLVTSIKENTFNTILEDIKTAAEESEGEIKTTNLLSKGNIWNCYYEEEYGDYYLYGFNTKDNLYSYVYCEDFSQEEFNDFLNNLDNDGDLLVYPQVRKSLYLLPKGKSSDDMGLFYFYFKKVDEDYAKSRDYVLWAQQIVGHWNSSANMNVDGEIISITFFDMDYDFNAKKVYDQFVEEHEDSNIDNTNHSVTLFEPKDAWFVSTGKSREVSFSKNSFIIAVNSYTESDIYEEKLIEISKDLQVW